MKIHENPNLQLVECELANERTHSEDKFKSNNLMILNDSQIKLMDNANQTITFADPILTLNERRFINPNTINLIQGKAGAHKSRLTEHIASILISEDQELSILGMSKNENFGPTVAVYIDTERNIKEQYPYAIQSIRKNAGYATNQIIPRLNCHSMIEIPREERLSTLKELIADLKHRTDDHIIIILDVLTDFIKSFNDERESLKLIDYLNDLINNYDITILGVIHENPSKKENKARGHLGTEMHNKASMVLSLAFPKDDSEIVEIKFLKNRIGSRNPSVLAKFNRSTNRLELANSFEQKSLGQKKADYTEIIDKLISFLKPEPQEAKKIISLLCIQLDCSDRTIKSRLQDIIASGAMGEYGYKLLYEDVPDRKQNKKQYRLEEIGLQEEIFPNPFKSL